MAEIVDSQLQPELKAEVTRCLHRILAALDEYRITGGLGIIESVECALGHAAIDSEYRSFLEDEELGRRVFEAISAAANLLTVAVTLPALTAALATLPKLMGG